MIRSNTQEIDINSINPAHLLGQLGWTHERIAERIKYSSDAVKSWSCGRRKPSFRAKEVTLEVFLDELKKQS